MSPWWIIYLSLKKFPIFFHLTYFILKFILFGINIAKSVFFFNNDCKVCFFYPLMCMCVFYCSKIAPLTFDLFIIKVTFLNSVDSLLSFSVQCIHLCLLFGGFFFSTTINLLSIYARFKSITLFFTIFILCILWFVFLLVVAFSGLPRDYFKNRFICPTGYYHYLLACLSLGITLKTMYLEISLGKFCDFSRPSQRINNVKWMFITIQLHKCFSSRQQPYVDMKQTALCMLTLSHMM